MLGTPAITAGAPSWARTLGYDALPEGQNSATDGIGVTFSPKVRPGLDSNDQSWPLRTMTCSLNRAMLTIITSMAATTAGSTCEAAAANSSSVTRSRSGSMLTPSKSRSARHTASSPLARTSSMIWRMEVRSVGSKISRRPRWRRSVRSSGDIVDQVIVRSTDAFIVGQSHSPPGVADFPAVWSPSHPLEFSSGTRRLTTHHC